MMPRNSASWNSSSRSASTTAMTGHFKKANVAPMKVLQEVRIKESKDETKVGDRVLVENFAAGELVDITGVSKGRGFAAA